MVPELPTWGESDEERKEREERNWQNSWHEREQKERESQRAPRDSTQISGCTLYLLVLPFLAAIISVQTGASCVTVLGAGVVLGVVYILYQCGAFDSKSSGRGRTPDPQYDELCISYLACQLMFPDRVAGFGGSTIYAFRTLAGIHGTRLFLGAQEFKNVDDFIAYWYPKRERLYSSKTTKRQSLVTADLLQIEITDHQFDGSVWRPVSTHISVSVSRVKKDGNRLNYDTLRVEPET